MAKSFKNKKATIALVMISMFLLTAVAAFAMYQFQFSVENEFRAETLNIGMEESFSPKDPWKGEVVAKEVRYTNKGTTPALLRVLYSENFKNRDTGIYLSTKDPVDGLDIVKKNWNVKDGLNTSNWVYKDGWYYYKHLLKPGEAILTLESIEIPKFTELPEEYAEADYELSFSYEYIEAIEKMAHNLWKVDETKFKIGADGKITWGF